MSRAASSTALRTPPSVPTQAEYDVWEDGRIDAPSSTSSPDALWDVLDGATSRPRVERALDLLRSGDVAQVWWSLHAAAGSGSVPVRFVTLTRNGEPHAPPMHCTVQSGALSPLQGDALAGAAAALARASGSERIAQELSQQLLRTTACDAVVVALDDPRSGDLTIAHAVGFPREAPHARLRARWLDAVELGLATAAAVEGFEITLPLEDADPAARRGACTLRWGADAAPDTRALAPLAHALVRVATAALERDRTEQRASDRRRAATVAATAGSIGAELRNQIVGVSSAAQLLRYRAAEDPVMERNVGRVLRDVEQLNALANALQELAAPHALRLTPMDPDAVWDDVIEGHRGALERRALSLERTRAAHRARCAIDAARLAQAFGHILRNAIEAAPEESTITLASFRLQNGAWRSVLHNGGAPIPPELLPRVFDLLVSGVPHRSGVGLALTRQIVDEHQGAVTIESGPAAADGTRVVVTLPGTADRG
ncbi:MAG TPA: HAMP domain-containing sensor histidine kinase [Gemmatimonadaceae bacterium]|nr:HAMP domain-containing sensor histidine kinase [Gemmatimonadaceae bacterium]